jgi:N-methylhydantoinase A
VTDANLVLGLLNPDGLLGGRLRLERDRAEAALRPIADHFNLGVFDAAQGIYRIVNASMAEAIREVTVKRGVDPRDFLVVSFGGAGGQHAAAIAHEMEIAGVVFPRNASTLSAFGLLTADLKNTTARSLMAPLAQVVGDRLHADFAALEADARTFLRGEEATITRAYADRWADIRYIGQSHEVAVPVDSDAADPARLYERFENLHEQLYGTRLGDPAEVVNIRVTVTGEVSRLEMPRFVPREIRTDPVATRQTAFLDTPLAVYWRDGLPPGWTTDQPCLVEEVDSVIFIPGGTARVDDFGNLRLHW